MRLKGKITSWNDEKGFGFIDPIPHGKRIFVHANAFINRNRRPSVGQAVYYETSSDRRGRPCAAHAAFPDDRAEQGGPRSSASLPVVGAALFLALVFLAALSSKIPITVLAAYLVVSAATYVIYAIDKSAAKHGAWRTPESTLHFLALAGGWPGAVVAQQKLHHKSKKASFRTVFWVTVFINCGLFAWLFTAAGSAALQAFLAGMA